MDYAAMSGREKGSATWHESVKVKSVGPYLRSRVSNSTNSITLGTKIRTQELNSILSSLQRIHTLTELRRSDRKEWLTPLPIMVNN